MKKLLLLLLLVGVNANGADSFPVFSVFGLEGIAKDGITINVGDSSKTLNKKNIQNQIELRLTQAGVKINPKKTGIPFLTFKAMDILQGQSDVLGHVIQISVSRMMQYEGNDIRRNAIAKVWDKWAIVPKGKERDVINIFMDEFLLEYLKANPKKKD